MPNKTTPKNLGFGPTNGEASRLNPLVLALALALIYIVLCSLYIWFSGKIAAQLAESVAGLEFIERIKGLAFVATTGILLFCLAFFTLRKIALQDSRLLAQQKALVTTERIATAGLFATSTCHDINNIMAAVHANLELLPLVAPLNPAGKKCVDDALSACTRLNQMVKRLLTVGHDKLPGTIGEIDLSQLVREITAFAAPHKRVRQCTLTTSLPEHLSIQANPSIIGRMLLNLILNAADATNETGRIDIRLIDRPDAAIIEVHDNGPGVPQDQRKIIFEPFYTTKASGNGLGLLSLKVCVQEHQGTVEVTDSDLGGACFRITLPHRR